MSECDITDALSRAWVCCYSSFCLPFCLQLEKRWRAGCVQDSNQRHGERRAFLERGTWRDRSRQKPTPEGQLCP